MRIRPPLNFLRGTKPECRKKSLKRRVTIIISIVFFIFLIISIITFLRRDYLADIVEQKVVHIVENAVGRKLQFSGSHINIFPFYWQLNDIILRDAKTGDVLLKAKDTRVYLLPGKLPYKMVFIESIKFTEPLVSIIRYPDGRTNLEGLFPKRPANGWDTKIDKIEVIDGHLRFDDQITGRDIELKKIAGHIIPDFKKKEFNTDITTTGDYRDAKLSQHDLEVKGNLIFEIKERMINRVQVKGISISSGKGSTVSANGVIMRDGSLDLKGKAVISLKDIPDDIRPKKNLQGKVTFKGGVKGNLALPVVEGYISIDELAYDGVKYGKFKGDLSWKENLLTLTNLKGNVLNGHIEGNIRLDSRKDVPSYNVRLKGDSIRPYRVLTRYVPAFNTSLEKNGTISAEIEASGEGFDRDMLVSKGWITYKDNGQKISLSGGIEKGVNLSIGLTGEVKDIARHLRIPHFPLHGLASLSGEITGAIDKPVVSGVVMMPEGVVNGITFDSVTADLRLFEDTLHLQTVTFRRGTAVYNISGNIGFRSPGFRDPYFDMEADIDQGYPRDVVSIFYRELQLDMKASGKMRFNGDIKDFTGSADLKVSGGSAYDESFDNGYVALTLTKDKVIFDRLEAERNGEILAGRGWIGLRGESGGEFQADIGSKGFSLQNVDFLKRKLPFLSGTGAFSIAASGKLSDPGIRASVHIPHLSLKGLDTGYARLIIEKNASHTPPSPSMGEGKGGGDLTMHGQLMDIHFDGNAGWHKEAPFTLNIHLVDSSIHPFLALLRPSIAKDVIINASGEIVLTGELSNLNTLQADAILSQVTGIYGDYRVENDGEMRLSYADNKLSFDVVRFKGEGTSMGIIGNLIPYGDTNVFINGEADLRLLTLFTPEIKYSKGKAFVAFLISGEIQNPSIQGGLAIREGTIRSATLKQTLEGAELSLFFNGREIVLESMHGNLGGGTVNVTGKAAIREFVIKEFGFVLEIANAVFRYPEGLTSKIDGTLIFQGTPESKGLRGELYIKKALYEKPLNIRSLILELQRKKAKVEQPLPFIGDTELNIHVAGKRDLWVNNNIAKFPVEVDLMLKGTVDHPLLFGRIGAQDGTFVFSRNDFKVVTATVDFVSPDTIRPVLDVHATTEVRGHRISLKLSGTVDRFNLSFSSDPPLSDTDILALLTTGQTASEAAETMAEVGASEATAFLTAPIQEKLEEALTDIIKIDRFQVDPYYSNSTTSGGARLTIGKRLMDDRLYVTYTTGITTVEELIKLEYLLGKNVYLVGERDELGRMSGDVKFRFEFK